jgi:hypothetical protein
MGYKGLTISKQREELGVPENFDVMAMIAIGQLGPKENLLLNLQEREYPSDRKPIEEIVMDGKFISKLKLIG